MSKKISFYNSSLIFFFILLLLLTNSTFSKGKGQKMATPYEWAPLPQKEYLKEVMKTKSEKGLVVLERNCEIKIGGLLDWYMGYPSLFKEEFVRFLIVDENGLKNAEEDIETILVSKAEALVTNVFPKIDVVEARVVLPDGKIVFADKDKDIVLVTAEKLNEKGGNLVLGRVKFPQVQVGAILDLHYKINANYLVFAWSEPLPYKNMPTMKLKMKFVLTDNIVGWQVVTFNAPKSDVLKLVKPNEIELNLEKIYPQKDEPYSPPSLYYHPFVLAFANFSKLGNLKEIPKNWTGSIILDERGLPLIKDIDTIPFKSYWQNYLNEFEESRKSFIKKGSEVFKSIDPDLLNLSVSDRAKRVVDFVQKRIKMLSYSQREKNEEKGKKFTLSKSLQEGFESKEKVTYFISYLFDKYKIPYEKGIIVSRSLVRFSPFIPNAYIFDPIYALKVLVEGQEPIFVTGDINLPFGCIDSQYQLSTFISIDKDGILHSEITPESNKDFSKRNLKFEITVNEDGTMAGKVTLEEMGPSVNSLIRYFQNKKAEELENTKQKKKKKKDEEIEKKSEKIEDELAKEEINLINDNIKIDEWKIVKVPENSMEPLTIEYKISSKKYFEKIGDIIPIYVLPLIAQATKPFIDNKREFPIWFDDAMKTNYDGTIILPKGYTIEDLPRQESFDGGKDVNFTFLCEKGEINDRKALKVNLKVTRPLMLKVKDYQLIKGFYSSFVSVAQSKAIIRKAE